MPRRAQGVQNTDKRAGHVGGTEALGELTRAVMASPDPASLLGRAAAMLAAAFGAAEVAYLTVVQDQSGDLVVAADAHNPHHRGRKLLCGALSGDVRRLLSKGRAWARATEAKSEQTVPPPGPLCGPLTETSSPVAPTMTGHITLLIAERRVLGLQWVGSPRGGDTLPAEQAELAEQAAAIAALALSRLNQDLSRSVAERDRHREHRRQLTKLEDTNRKLRAAIESRNREVGLLIHDLRGPIGVVQGHIGVLRNQTTASSALRKSIDAVDRQNQRLLSTVENLLLHFREPASAAMLEPCDLRLVIYEWSEDAAHYADEHGVRMHVEVRGELGVRRVDPGRLAVVVRNLLDAAIEASEADDEVRLRVDLTEDDRLRIRVADARSTVPDGFLEQSFSSVAAFDELDEPAATGVGPAWIAETVRLLGGELTARNRPTGGAEYSVIVPALPDELANDDTAPVSNDRFRVLVIDPEPRELHRQAQALCLNFEVVTARTAREARWLLQQGHIDCAVIHLDSPMMKAFTTAKELRNDPAREHLPVLFTADADLSGVPVRRRGEILEDVLFRPVEPEELDRRVARAIAESIHRAALAQNIQTDKLTGLMTTTHARSELAAQLEHAAASSTLLSVLLVDIDDMGQINSRFDETVGDLLIQRIARVLRQVTRSSELVARWGGDEFLCILPGTSVPAARLVADRVRRAILDCRAGAAGATVSIGLATAGIGEELRPDELIARADTVLSVAKHRGNAIEIWKKRPSFIPSAPARRKPVLIVDDNQVLLRALERYFRKHTNHPIVTATGLDDALRKARVSPPSVAILDLRLPDGSGCDLLRELRRVGDPKLPAIAFTGRRDAAVRDETEVAGFNACVEKGGQLETLAKELTRWLH